MAVAAAAYSGRLPNWGGTSAGNAPISVPVTKGTLRIVVTERGNLESVKTVDGVCELTGFQNKIIQLVPEGSHVEKGSIVCRFDSAELDKNIAQQEIKAKQASAKIETTEQEVEIARNTGESGIIGATVELNLAVLDLEMYQKGTYIAETEKNQGEIALKAKELVEAKNALQQMEGLVKKGFKGPSDLRAAQGAVDGRELEVKALKSMLMVKEKYEYKRKSTEHESKVDQSRKKVAQEKAKAKASVSKADSEFVSAKATHSIEADQLKTFLGQKEKTVIKAEQSGIVAYANEPWYPSDRQIREGATIYSRQKIYSLPDMSSMQVKVNIHESLIKKIKPGQKAEIRVESFPNLVIVGTVKSVSQLADSNRGWMSGGVKEYTTVVAIEKMPKEELRPGMTSEVKILVGELGGSLIVPLQAVSQRKGKYFAYVYDGKKVDRRDVKVGDANDYQVQVLEGLKEGDAVCLDARARILAEFKDKPEDDEPGGKAAPKAVAPPGPGR